MKRILHISKFYYPYFGGIEDVVKTIVDTLSDDYDQQVICFNHQLGSSTEQHGAIRIERIGILGKISSQPIPYLYWARLNRAIRRFRPDFIHFHMPNPLICLLILITPWRGAKLVVHWHADILNNSRFFYGLCKPFEHAVLKRASQIIITSPEYASESIPLKGFQEKLFVLPNTVNEKKLPTPSQEEIDKLHNRYDNRKIVLALGRHVEYKGFDYLVRTAKYLPSDTLILIAGEGVETEHLHQLATGYGNIGFLGRIPDAQLSLYLHAADVFAFPSIDRREAFGVALAEALYCGAPAVTFYIKGSGTIWVNQDEKTGLVVHTFSPEAYARALNRLLSDTPLRHRLGANATEWVKDNFLPNQVEKLRQVYV